MTAVVWGGLEGTETGNALVDVIYGAANPSGRLPYTIAKSPKDYLAQLVLGGKGKEISNITYSEGCVCCVSVFFFSVTTLLSRRLFVDYRHFDSAKITPRFEFGFELSYTAPQYSGLNITSAEEDQDQDQDRQLEANWLVKYVRKGSARPRLYGCTTRRTPYRSRCRIRAKSLGRRYAFFLPLIYFP